MFFEKEIRSFYILAVLELSQKNANLFNHGRNFNALSFRFRADTRIKTQTDEYVMKDNYVMYMPAQLDYTRISTEENLIAVHFETTNAPNQNIEYFLPEKPEVFAELFRNILDCWNKKESGYKYKCSAILYEILAECYLQNKKEAPKTSKIRNSVEYILQHYKNSELTMREIANQSFMCEVYFRKIFKEEYGISPQKYIIRLRIQNAISLISSGYYSLKEAAYMSGYNDYKYFSVEFKKNTGVSPSEYLHTLNTY